MLIGSNLFHSYDRTLIDTKLIYIKENPDSHGFSESEVFTVQSLDHQNRMIDALDEA